MPAVLTKEMALEVAEEQIQKILIDLVNKTGIEVESVEVDTRRFGNLRCQIIASGGYD